jgi:hypothetical protein
MPAIRVNRLLPAVVAALALLFAVLDPEASRGLPFPAALAFWMLHIGVGMLLAVRATEWISRARAARAWNPWLRLLAGGVVGSVVFAPLALAFDTVLPLSTHPETDGDLLDRMEAGGGALALLAEWLQMSPSYLASWLLVNAVPLAAGPALQGAAIASLALADAPVPAPVADADRAGAAPSDQPAAAPADAASTDRAADSAVAARAAFLEQLPPAIGTDLIAIQADLHYLQVRTTRGRATLLASIAAAEDSLGATGLRVHRSHWVASAHVVRMARTARGTFLTLSDGSRVPVSRRRTGDVQARLGRDFVVDPV